MDGQRLSDGDFFMKVWIIEDNAGGGKGEQVKIPHSTEGVVGCKLGVEELGVGSRSETIGDFMDCG